MIVWSIGFAAESPWQFAGSWRDGLVFRIGHDDPSQWPAFHPGPLDASSGWRDHRASIRFDVAAAPTSPLVLQLRFAASHGPCPDLRIDIDGVHCGLWHPVVRRDNRARVYRHGPIAGDVALDVPLPAEWFAPGEHVVSITTTLDERAVLGDHTADDPHGGRHHEQFGHHFGSGLTWHGLQLATFDTAPQPSVELAALPLYVRRSGHLHELIELTVTAGPAMPAHAVVEVAGRDHAVDLRTDRDFGQVRRRIAVPELDGPTTAIVSVDGAPPQRFELAPARKWTLHVIPHVHLDVGYTDRPAKALELHARNLDRALAALDKDPGFAFAVDGAVIVQEYLRSRPSHDVARLLDALRSGRITVNAFHSLFLSGLISLEEMFRGTTIATRLRAEHGVRLGYATLTDVPSYSSAVPAVLTALGIDAFVGTENHHRGDTVDTDLQHLASPVRWQGVDGTQVLTHFSDTYSQLRFMVGDPQTLAGGAHSFPRLLRRFDRDDYLPHDLAVLGAHADNEDLADGDAGFVDRWNAVYAYPRLCVSTINDYLDAVRPLADRLPVWRGDGGSYWEDGAGTAAAHTAMHRAAQVALPVAEALSTLVGPVPNRDGLDDAWAAMAFGPEHTFTWSASTAHPHGGAVEQQLSWHRRQVQAALGAAEDEIDRALSRLAEQVTTDGPALLVVNPLGWTRDVDVEFEGIAGTTAGQLPAEVLSDCDGWQRLRIRVPDVPGFGYRVLPLGTARTLSPGDEGVRDAAAGPAADDWEPVDAIDSPLWTVRGNPGVSSLVHRPSGRELLDAASPWHLAQLLVVRTEPAPVEAPPAHSGDPHRHPHPPRDTLLGRTHADHAPSLSITSATLRSIGAKRTFDGWRLRSVGSAPGITDLEVDVLLRDADSTVEVLVTFTKERFLGKESVYVAFPFAVAAPAFHYDRQLGWINPATDHYPGAGNEWFTTQYGVVVSSQIDSTAVQWSSADAPLCTFGDIVRGTWPRTFEPATSTIFSWATNNYWPTNTPPEQDGRLRLRYAFTPVDAFDAGPAARWGREHRICAVASEITRLDKYDREPRPRGAGDGRLFGADLPPTVHATVAAARTRDGRLVRLQELAGQDAVVRLPASAATLCRADEQPLAELEPDADGTATVRVPAWQVVSVLMP